MIRAYPAIIDVNLGAADRAPAEGKTLGRYGVTFPDVPGCHSAGDTVTQAIEHAKVALTAHLVAMAAAGLDLPAATELGAVMPDPDLTVAAVVMIATGGIG